MQFTLTDKQIEKIKKFHPKHKKISTGTIGGGEVYRFMPTGLGSVVTYVCKCGKELDVTEIEKW